MSGTSPLLQPSSKSVDLQGDSSLQMEISDAVTERDKVKFTVQTKVRLQGTVLMGNLLPSASAVLGDGGQVTS